MSDDLERMMGGDEPDAKAGLDPDLEKEIDQALGEMSLEQMADGGDEEAGGPEGLRKGRVVAVQGDDVFVSFGGKDQGIVPAVQFEDEPLPSVGDMVEVMVDGYDEREGLLKLNRKGAVQAATWESIHGGQVVEAHVTGLNKGGLEVKIQGSIKAFMPISHVDIGHVEELDPYLNEKLRCKVIEVDRSDKKVVVSRKALQEQERAEAAERTRQSLEEGQVVKGTVKTVMPYGAFVDIGGIDGLLHVSDMSFAHVGDPKEIVEKGQEVEVKVLKVDWEKERISLGLKQTMQDPWEKVAESYPPESVVTGKVTRLADFGAFVELEPGVEGLIPISEMSWQRRLGHPKEVLTKGEDVKALVMNVDPAKKRMSLSLKRLGDDPWMGASVRWPEGETFEGKVTRTTDFGAFVELAPGVEGLVHISELSDGFVRSVDEVVQTGENVQVRILSVDEEKRRISLSMKSEGGGGEGGGQASEADVQAYMQSQEKQSKQRRRKKHLKGGLD